ncbi:hypothetical protein PGB90_002236 [Kerria lacca]
MKRIRLFSFMNNFIIILSIAFILCFAVFSNCSYVYETKYIDVPLDHFSYNDNRTFSLKYLVNDSYWKIENGPIFFYTGNEGDIEIFAQNTGFLWESAVEFNALIVFAEHRYYGTSLPFGNLSLTEPKYFGYLTSEQALADFVDVIYHIKTVEKFNQSSQEKIPHNRLNPVIAFGGSYGGMLAAWMRMKYPAVIEGALASSAPIWQFTGMSSCNAFYDITTSVYNSTSHHCINNIRKSWTVIKNITISENGKNWINEHWKLCTPIKVEEDVNVLINWLTNVYVNMAMINYPYSANFLMPVPANPVKEMCKHLNHSYSFDEKLLMAVFRAVSVYFNYTGCSTCLQWKSDPSTNLDSNAWNIQACTEMVMPICSNAQTDMFVPQEWNFKNYLKKCFKTYGMYPQKYKIEKLYGGKKLNAISNIIFSNGELDPWMSGGVTYAMSPTIYPVVISKSAHHLDLRAANKHDPISVIKARKFYIKIFRKWIVKYYNKLRRLNSKFIHFTPLSF